MGCVDALFLRRTAALLLNVAVLSTFPGALRAGGFTACDAPFIFGTAANIVPVEFVATSADRDTSSSERLARLQKSAQRLAWLIKLDSWHQPTYGSLGVVAHLFIDRQCEPDEVLAGLLRGSAGRPLRPGQVLLMLQGRIFIEGDGIFLQTRLRGFRRNEIPVEDAGALSKYFATEDMTTALHNGTYPLKASLPPLDITFTPRAFTAAQLNHIDQVFGKASVVYSDPMVSGDGESLRFAPGRPQAFTVQLLDGGKWIRVEDIFGGVSGFIQTDPAASATLHEILPELDFVNGLLGFLRIAQARQAADFPPPPEHAAEVAQASLARFLANDRSMDDVDARALAHALRGILSSAWAGDWKAAREQFAAAADVAPYSGTYRNLLGVADAMLCCAGTPQDGFADPARAFTDSLSLAPQDREALINLESFLAFLSDSKKHPKGIDTSRLAERRTVVRRVVSNLESGR